jgi:NADPH:quinone reductase-like Zn-dependent oxidoreductase
MARICTEAWVLKKGPDGRREPGSLEREEFSFTAPGPGEVIAEPLLGCWEGNMTHAVRRDPVDICAQRGEEKVIIGNAGVVRVVGNGPGVTSVKEGDVCVFAPVGTTDRFGFLQRVTAYDAPGTMGLLAKRIKVKEGNLLPIPESTRFSTAQWAAFSLRYPTAWASWKLAYGCWRQQMSEDQLPVPFVWAWGGGVAFAELTLARFLGARTAMVASCAERLELIEQAGITAIDRRPFGDLAFDDVRYRSDLAYRERYQQAESTFLDEVKRHTDGLGVSIFFDNIGLPVHRATLKALAGQGVVATVGWKKGMDLKVNRALECIHHHIHVHGHGARIPEAKAAMQFAEQMGWLPPVNGDAYAWEDIPQLADDHAADRIPSYFPMFRINAH